MFDLIPFGKSKREDGFAPLARSLQSLFDDRFSSPFKLPSMPAFGTDVRESEKEYVIEAELPGFRKEDINIESSGPYLTIRASRNEEVREENDGQRYVRRERRYGEYVRRFYMPDLHPDGIRASLKNGVLSVRAEKSGKPGAKRIDIEDGA